MAGTDMDNQEHFVLAVGASGSDGLQDMCDLLAEIPERLSATILCTLHRPPDRKSYLHEVLQRRSKVEVRIASDGERLKLGCCYIGLPAQPLTLTNLRRALLIPISSENRARTVDLLFSSVAAHAAGSGLGVVLAGSLSDGSRGIEAIKRAAGAVFARAPWDTAVMGMPAHAIARAGPLHLVAAVPDLAREIVRRCGLAHRLPDQQPASADSVELLEPAGFQRRPRRAGLQPATTLPMLVEQTKSL
jgi:two-component system, chemotaxis family, protein-glutamate methylesterase/glutaminase